LVVDDEVDTGATVLGVVRMLKGAGAKSVTVAAVHGVLSGPAAANLKAAGYDRLFLTDTIPFKLSQFSKVKLLSAAPALAEAVARRSQWL
jgi:ribose-phosphate pyrophosphokinase